MPSISVIISTYNKPHFLEKVLTGYCFQTFNDFEIIIADDGSSNETKEMITKFEQFIPQKIYHVWHEDNGFRKCKILNTNRTLLLYTNKIISSLSIICVSLFIIKNLFSIING